MENYQRLFQPKRVEVSFIEEFNYLNILIDEARIDGKVIFRRLGATHALDYYKPQASDQLILDKPIELETSTDEELPTNMIDKLLENESQSNVQFRQRRVMRDVSKMMEEPPIQMPKRIIDEKYNFSLPMGKKKVLHETKTIGITFRDTKLFGTTGGFLKHHRRKFALISIILMSIKL